MVQNEGIYKPLTLHAMVSDGMVLQRNAEARVWGWSEPHEKIRVRFLNRSYQTAADAAGKWTVTLEKHSAGGPYEMEIEGREKIVVHDILIGDVWICSGQSNMQLPTERVKDKYPDVVAHAENPFIRQFTVPEQYDFCTPRENPEGGVWEPVNKDTILKFTAAGYFFAEELYRTYSVPIGLIKMAIGGSHVEAWMNRESLQGYPDKIQTVERFSDSEYVDSLIQREADREKEWYERLDRNDQGLQSGQLPWYDEDCDDSDWPQMPIPSYWAEHGLGAVNGSFWFRREVDLPASLAGRPARIFMGRIVDADYVYINGVLVGTTAYQYPPRKYDVPAGLLKEGRNTIAVRVISNRGKGGFITEKPYELIFSDQTVDLSGPWKYRVGTIMEELPDKTFLHQIPLGLFNGMLSPVADYTVKGVIWYQGESNTPWPEQYADLFTRMILEWRKKLNRQDLPFLYVQLPNYLERENMLAVNQWAPLREAQQQALRLPHTAMAVAIDVGEWNDLHPLNKRDVGKRLALAARKVAYGEEQITAAGPTFEKMEVQGNKAMLSFSNTGSGLVSKDGEPLRNFEIAGKDGIFYPAEAHIENNRVVVSAQPVTEPVAVRYAWSDSPQNINFYNREGLPAAPFRTGQ